MTNSIYPDLSDGAIEAAASALIASFEEVTGNTLTAPIPVERIAENFLGYRIEVTDQGLFADPDYLGGIDLRARQFL